TDNTNTTRRILGVDAPEKAQVSASDSHLYKNHSRLGLIFISWSACERGVARLIPVASGALMETMLITHRLAAPLASYVETLWYYEGFRTAPHKERVLPNGRFQMVINLSAGAGAVAGMRSRYV